MSLSSAFRRTLAKSISEQLTIPTIGIGAGKECDGQVLVLHDLLGLTSGRLPKHVRMYAALRNQITDAFRQYHQEVQDGAFPGPGRKFLITGTMSCHHTNW